MITVVLTIFAVASASAQQPADVQVKTTKISKQFAPMTEKLVAAIKQISDGRIRFAINTHVHVDHTGGNENLGKLGATIVARENLRTRLMKSNAGANGAPGVPAPPMALPVVTDDAPVTVHMNGEDVHLIPCRPRTPTATRWFISPRLTSS